MMISGRSVASIGGICAIVLTAGCGGDGGTPDAGQTLDPENPVVVRVSETAGLPSAFLQFGEDQGFFLEHGIDLEIDSAAGGAATIPGLVSGNYDVGGSNSVSVLLAASQGVPIQVIAPGSFASTDPQQDYSAVIVPEDSPITSLADLEGASIAVNTLRNIPDVTVRAAMANAGADSATVEFVELPFTDMLPALADGRVDAANVIEPFVQIGFAAGNRPVSWTFVEAMPGLQVGSFVASRDYIESNPAVIEAFRLGQRETAQAITEDPDSLRAALPEITTLDPEVAESVVFANYRTDIDLESFAFLNDRMEEYGLITSQPDLETVIAPGTAGADW